MSGYNQMLMAQQQPMNGSYPPSQAPNFSSSQPYAYGMANTNPQPMMGVPSDNMPPLYPSTMTPQLNPPKPFTNTNLAQAQYAAGGQVDGDYGVSPQSLSQLAEMIAQYQMQPQQGAVMPHYKAGGSWRNAEHRKFGGKLGKFIGRVAAPIAGGFLGGPIGAGLGGALGNSLTGGNPLMGAALGFGGSALLGGLLGGPGTGLFGGTGGNLFGHGLFGDALYGGSGGSGLGSLFGGGSGYSPNLGGTLKLPGGEAAGGLGLGSLMRKGMDYLPAVALLSSLGAKKEIPKESTSLSDYMAQAQQSYGPHQQYKPTLPTERIAKILSDEERKNPSYFEDTNPPLRYAATGGYLDGHTGGQDDKIKAMLSDGEYVVSADVVSSLGDGNNSAGAKKLDSLMSNVRKHKVNNAKQGKLPPPAKSLSSYMKGVR